VANYILDNKAQFERDLADAKKEILQLQELQLQVG